MIITGAVKMVSKLLTCIILVLEDFTVTTATQKAIV